MKIQKSALALLLILFTSLVLFSCGGNTSETQTAEQAETKSEAQEEKQQVILFSETAFLQAMA